MCGLLWGDVSPRLSDALFQSLFPAGYQGLIWGPAVLGACIIVYLLIVRGARDYDSILRDILFVTCAGFFFLPLATALGLLLVAKADTSPRKGFSAAAPGPVTSPDTEPRAPAQESKRAKLLRMLPRALSSALFLGAFLLGTYELVFEMHPGLGWSLISGSAAAASVIAGCRLRRVQWAQVIRSLHPRWTRGAKCLAIVLPILAGGTILWATFWEVPGTPPAQLASSGQTSLKIVSYNIRLPSLEKNLSNSWEFRKGEVADYMNIFGADIIGVQEAYVSQIYTIIGGLTSARYAFTGQGRDDGAHGGEHTAILFNVDKFRVVDGDTFWLSDTPNVPSKQWVSSHYRVCTWARFEVLASGVQFAVFCTHYGWGNSFDRRASELICARVQQVTADLPTFVLGDFNMYNDSEGYAVMEGCAGKPLTDAWRLAYGNDYPRDYSTNNWTGPSIPAKGDGRIDFVFCSPGITVTSAIIPKDLRSNGQTYSDHYPIFVNCSF